MRNPFGLVVIGNDGGVINKILSPNLPLNIVEEAIALGRDIYRLLQAIAEEFNYSLPKTVSLVLDDYEIVLIKKKDKIIVAIYLHTIPGEKLGEALAEA